jgi:transcriptional regulator with XRE-family HTH domain
MIQHSSRTLGSRIKLLRKSKGWSLRQVERLTGISNAHLSMIERGLIKDPGVFKVWTLAKLFNVTVDDLIKETPKEKP